MSDDVSLLSFEDALAELDQIVRGLEGGTLQATITYRRGKNLTDLAGLGVNQQIATIDGSTTTTTPGGASVTAPGGVLALRAARMAEMSAR